MVLQTIKPAVCSTACGGAPNAITKCYTIQAGIILDVFNCSSTQSGVPLNTSCEVTLNSTQTCSSTIRKALCANPTDSSAIVDCDTTTTATITVTTNPAKTTSGANNGPISSASYQTLPSQTSAISQPKDIGINNGEAAGIAIGCAIAGAVIAGLIFLCLFMRYKKRHQQQPISAYAQHVGHYPEQITHDKSHVTTIITGASLVDNYLPQPAADDAIIGDFSRLRDKIKDHVQSYYHLSPVNLQAVDQNKLEEIAIAAGIPASRMKELFLNPHSRLLAIRLYLAWMILSRCSLQGQRKQSFLPAEVASFAQLIAGIDKANNGQITLASKWKSISGTLLQSRYGQLHSTEDDVLDHNIGQAIAVADSALTPFIGSANGVSIDNRLQNLEGIMRRAAKFAFVLFSQPSDWAFEWLGASSGLQPGRLVVFPGLLQTVSDEGYVQQPPRLLSEAEVVSGF